MTLRIVMSLRPTDFADALETEVEDLDMAVKPVTEDWRRQNKVPVSVGAVVVRIKAASAAQLGGLRFNDLIVAVDRELVRDPKGLVELLAAARKAKRKKIVFMVRRSTGTAFVAVEPNW
jgi:S1-C subfamily serine protease